MPTASKFLPPSGYDEVNARQRIQSIVRALNRTYPAARTALRYASPFELLVATILSAQCTDEKVNQVTPELFDRWPSPEALAAADPTAVEAVIYPTGFFRQKTKSVIGCSQAIVGRFGGEMPRSMEELVTLPGVARKTANVVMSNCWPNAGHGIFVDTHVARISQRLGLTPSTDPVHIERDLMALLPKRRWVDVPHQLIELGRGPCEAKRPRHAECPLRRWCPSAATVSGAAASADRTTRRAAAGGARPAGSRRRSR